jgi:hypothetical protein
MTSTLNSELIRRSGLDLQKIEVHHDRIIEFVKTGRQKKYEVRGICSLENYGVIDRQSMLDCIGAEQASESWSEAECKHIATVVLAAGAASRFFAPLTNFISEVEEKLRYSQKENPTLDQTRKNPRVSKEEQNIQESEKELQKLLDQSNTIKTALRHMLPESTLRQVYTDEVFQENSAFFEKNSGVDHSKPEDWCDTTAETIRSTYHASLRYLQRFSTLPKAVVPIDPNGDTLLSRNTLQQFTFCKEGDLYFVVAPGTEDIFKAEINRVRCLLATNSQINLDEFKYTLVNQGNENSTIRFSESAEPIFDEDGSYSVVAGGHGEVIHHFNSISDANTTIQCLHIRTIDNIFGQSDAVIEELRRLAKFFFVLKEQLDTLRKEVTALIELQLSSEHELTLKTSLGLKAIAHLETLVVPRVHGIPAEWVEHQRSEVSFERIYTTFEKLFYWPALSGKNSAIEILMKIEKLLMRPLTIFGVVQMTQEDVGGIPVFAQDEVGTPIRICLEGAHFQEKDKAEINQSERSKFFFNSAVVFVETEMKSLDSHKKTKVKRVNFNDLGASDVFLVAKKQHKGQTVLYHELAMFEILSHSGLVNSVFVEAPRAIFQPHKSILDLAECHRNK